MSNEQAPQVFVLSAETLASANAQREANAQQGWAEWQRQSKLKVGDQVRIGNGQLVWTIQGVYGTWASVVVRTVRRGIPYFQRKQIHDLSRLVRVEA